MTSVNMASFEEELQSLLLPTDAQQNEFAKEAEALRKLAAPGFLARAVTNAKADFGGLAKSLKNPVRSLKSSFRDNYMNLTTGNKLDKWKAFNAGMLGLSTAQGAHAALKKEDPTGKGRSRTERLGALAGGTAAGLLTLPHTRFALGLPVAIAGTMGGEALGGRLGRVISGRKPQPRPQPQQVQASAEQTTGPASTPVSTQQAAPVDRRISYQQYSQPVMQYGGNVTDPVIRAARQRYGQVGTYL